MSKESSNHFAKKQREKWSQMEPNHPSKSGDEKDLKWRRTG
jgi:hypothetical protein